MNSSDSDEDIWIVLEKLPAQCRNKPTLYLIAKMIGEPLELDSAMAFFPCPSVARFCVEVDVQNPLLKRFWIGKESSVRWQYINRDDTNVDDPIPLTVQELKDFLEAVGVHLGYSSSIEDLDGGTWTLA
ncbi:hypothetical protein ACH5RR_000979 [Cinchona calisaya]|uniref:Transposase n=1 Tax=Cinchona calisaya TaxID=153742 RepID=A0ABD3B2R6_9GENT